MRIFAEGWSADKDGPGQRLVLYLKGCNMRCPWCANPESVSPLKQILFHPERASGPFDYVCPRGALRDGRLDRARCESCDSFACATKWEHIAFELAGRDVSPQWVLERAQESKGLFGKDGGITFGGGEPTLQTEELIEAISLLKAAGVSSAIESNASTSGFMKAASAADFVICDLKSAEPERLLEYTGVSDAKIMANLREAASSLPRLLVRVPVVTAFNDGPASLDRILQALAGLNSLREASLGVPLEVELLRLHHMGAPKRKALGERYPMEGIPETPQALLDSFRLRLAEAGIKNVST